MTSLAQLERGVVGYWCPMLATTGLRLYDRSVRKNHSTLTNMDAATDWVTASVRGRSGRALEFSGSDTAGGNGTQNHVLIGKDLATDVIAFSAWIRPTTLNKRGLCTSGPTYAIPRLAVTLLTTGQIQCFRGGTVDSTLTVSAGAWHHICVLNDGSNTTFWINGRFSNTAAQSITTSLQTTFLLGNNFWGAFEGRIAEACIHSRRLTNAEVSTLYRLGPGWFGRRETRRRYAVAQAAGFKAYWNQRAQLLGGGLR